MKNLLITGGYGFIGSNFIKQYINEDINIFNVDCLTYAANLNNLPNFDTKYNYDFFKGNIQDKEFIENIVKNYQIDAIINFAAESHVDRSIQDSTPFIDTNIKGTTNLLDIANKYKIKKFIQISTDEVYGSLSKYGKFTENSKIKPNSPYSASKASADLIALSYYHTHNLNVSITRCSNNYGPNQHPEKLIPLIILNALENKNLPVYGNGMNIRDWIHVSDHCSAIWKVLFNGEKGEIYNVGANNEKTNLQIINNILEILNKPKSLITFINDRLGHDFRYAINNNKISKQLNWSPQINFLSGLKNTVEWYFQKKYI